MEFEFEVRGKKILARSVEIGRGYGVFTIFVEMPGIQHSGYLMKKGDKTLPKGVISRRVWNAGIEGLEAASSAPLDTNAIVLVRLSGTEFEDRLRRISEIIYETLREEDFI